MLPDLKKKYLLLIVVSVLIFFLSNCKIDPDKKLLEGTYTLSKDELILSQVINPLLDSNKYFFSNDFGFPQSNESTIDLGLIISDTLSSIENCGKAYVISVKSLNVDTMKYKLGRKDKCGLLCDCVLIRFSRVCLINDTSAFFYVGFYRDGDFSKDGKVTIKKRNNLWIIGNIKVVRIS